ncbi:MAG: hypothetical protein PF961_07580 [Planctomycetota bacterium]|nr:hypothetical protein [Planctomycetota bacterium]
MLGIIGEDWGGDFADPPSTFIRQTASIVDRDADVEYFGDLDDVPICWLESDGYLSGRLNPGLTCFCVRAIDEMCSGGERETYAHFALSSISDEVARSAARERFHGTAARIYHELNCDWQLMVSSQRLAHYYYQRARKRSALYGKYITDIAFDKMWLRQPALDVDGARAAGCIVEDAPGGGIVVDFFPDGPVIGDDTYLFDRVAKASGLSAYRYA